MAEPKTKFEYSIVDDEGKSVPITPKLEMDAHERATGLLGMLKWCQRVATEVGEWGFLPDGGGVSPTKVHVKLLLFEEHHWQTMMEMQMNCSALDGFIRVEGRFPVVII